MGWASGPWGIRLIDAVLMDAEACLRPKLTFSFESKLLERDTLVPVAVSLLECSDAQSASSAQTEVITQALFVTVAAP